MEVPCSKALRTLDGRLNIKLRINNAYRIKSPYLLVLRKRSQMMEMEMMEMVLTMHFAS